MMGAWFLATAYSEVIAAQFGKLTSLDGLEGANLAVAAAKYADSFQLMVWVGLGAAAVFVVLARPMRRWMHGVK
jgi:POT family proton-dependent oligopeptide transporter